MARDWCLTFALTMMLFVWRSVRTRPPFTHHVTLDPSGVYKMWWRFDNETITVKVSVKTTGWIGWGLSHNGKMKGSDMVIGWVDDNGKRHFSDRYAHSYSVPRIDEREDYKLHDMEETGGTTSMVFSRPITLCGDDDKMITTDTMRVLYAWNDADGSSDYDLHKHTKRGSKSVYLLDYGDRSANQDLPKTYNTTDLVMENISLPDWSTTYYCKAFILPAMSGKHHVVRIQTIITPGNEDHVHHMLLYQCTFVGGRSVDKAHVCYSQNMPDMHCGRDIVIHGWAIGGTDFVYPKDVGLSLNEPGDPKYLLLEIHYDNPMRRTDIVDRSGLRLVYTPNLRKIDASVLAMGIFPSDQGNTQIIPPKQKNFTTYGFCNHACLNVTRQRRHYVFAAGLHTHTYGRKIILRMVNNSDGVETKRIIEDLNYDFNFQEFRYLKEPVEILPGHNIHIECVYNTERRTDPLLSGLGTDDEMCLAYLAIYPKLNLKICYSQPTSYYTWGKDVFKWKLDQRARLATSVVFGGKDYKGSSAYAPLQGKEFWAEHFDLVENFEEYGSKSPYWRRCSFGKWESGRSQWDVTTPKLNVKLPEGNCTMGAAGDDRRVRPVLLFTVVALCAAIILK